MQPDTHTVREDRLLTVMETLQQRPTVNTEEESPRFERKELDGGAPVEETSEVPVDLKDNALVRGLQDAMDGDRSGEGGEKGGDKKGGGRPGSGVLLPVKTPEQIKKDQERDREVYRLDPEKITGSATIVGAIPHQEAAVDGNSLGDAFTNVEGQMFKQAVMPFQSLQDQQLYEDERWQEAFRQDGNRAGNITSFRPSGGQETPASEITTKVALVIGNFSTPSSETTTMSSKTPWSAMR